MTWPAILLVLHIIGIVIGAGAATLGDILFLSTLKKDGKIDASERDLLATISSVVWVGLFLLVVTGVSFLLLSRLDAQYTFVQGPAFWTKMLAVAVLFLNGLVLSVWVQPVIDASVGKPFGPFIRKQKRQGLVLTCGAISMASWYTALIIGAWRSIPLEGWQFPAAYAVFLVVALIGSHLVLSPRLLGTASSR